MTDRHPTANACQRARRARHPRIDYYPSAEAQAIVRANLGDRYPDNILSGVLDRIVTEWAQANGQRPGINNQKVLEPMSPAEGAGIFRPLRAGAYEFGPDLPTWAEPWLAANRAREASRRVVCGARRHRDGKPCRAKSEPGKARCKWHGGRSTGPRTPQGRAKALANLRQNRPTDNSGEQSPPSPGG